MIFERKRRHVERYLEIGGILAKHGWDNLLARFGLADLFRTRRRAGGVPPAPVQVREALEELGPTFIKLGQLLSTRPDIVPAEYAAELEKLQDDAPPLAVDVTQHVVREEFGCSAESVFEHFDERPLAAASIGQTHLAMLSDGLEVVVKVQRPGIRQVIDNDLEIVAGVARFLEQHFEQARTYGLSDLVDEFSITLMQELDYTREGRNGDRLAENFVGEEYIRIPATQWDYTTPRILTTERLKGIKITHLKELNAAGHNSKRLAHNLSKAFLKMVFVDSVFHGDPHPGNLVAMEGNVIGLLDYGQVGKLDPELKALTTRLLAEYVQEDSQGFSEVLLNMGISPPDLDRKAFTLDIDRLLRQYYGAPLSEVRMGEVLRRAFAISAKWRIRLPASIAVLMKALLNVESIDRALDPEFDFAAEARPFIARSIRNEFSLGRLKEQVLQSLLDWKELILELPHSASEVLDKMTEDRFRIVFRHEGLEDPIKDIDRSANRLSVAMITSATIVGAALVLSAEVGPVVGEYPIIGVIGFAIAFLFAIWLIVSIIRAGRMW